MSGFAAAIRTFPDQNIILIAHNHSALQGLQNVLVLGVRFGKNAAVNTFM